MIKTTKRIAEVSHKAVGWARWHLLAFSLMLLVLSGTLIMAGPRVVTVVLPEPDPYGDPPAHAHHDMGGGLLPSWQVGAGANSDYPRPDTFFADQGISFEFAQHWQTGAKVQHFSPRGFNPIESIMVHVTGPGTCPGMTGWFLNPASKASAHFGVCKDGSIIQYVELGDAAWHGGRVTTWNQHNPLIARWVNNGINPNLRTVGIEFLLDNVKGERLNDFPEMKASGLILMQWLARELNIPVDRTHIIGHHEVDGISRAVDPICCMDIQRDLIDEMLAIHDPAPEWGDCLPTHAHVCWHFERDRLEDVNSGYFYADGLWHNPAGQPEWGPPGDFGERWNYWLGVVVSADGNWHWTPQDGWYCVNNCEPEPTVTPVPTSTPRPLPTSTPIVLDPVVPDDGGFVSFPSDGVIVIPVGVFLAWVAYLFTHRRKVN